MGERFFEMDEFDSLSQVYARTEKPEIIKLRKQAAEKLRGLHRHTLGRPLAAKDLHPHPNQNYWTNVPFPKWEANGEWVDYLRFGYGKDGVFVKDMAKRAGFVKEITPYGTNDHMAFHYVAQVQIGLTCDYWFFNFYIDDKAWLEQGNLLEKIKQPGQRQKCEDLLQNLMRQGYALRIWSSSERKIRDDAHDSPTAFLNALELYREKKLSVNVDIDKRFDPRAPQNDADSMSGLAMQEFIALLPLYKFWAWHPTENHYIPGL